MNFVACPTIPGRLSQMQAKNLALAVYADPTMLLSHQNFQSVPFDSIHMIKTSVRHQDGEIHELNSYKPLDMTKTNNNDTTAERPTDESENEYNSWVLEESLTIGFSYQNDDKNCYRLGAILGAFCSEHPALLNAKTEEKTVFYTSTNKSECDGFLLGKKTVKLPHVLSPDDVTKHMGKIIFMADQSKSPVDFAKKYYLIMKNGMGYVIKEYPRGTGCLGTEETRQKSLDLLLPFTKNISCSKEGLRVDKYGNIRKFSTDCDIDDFL